MVDSETKATMIQYRRLNDPASTREFPGTIQEMRQTTADAGHSFRGNRSYFTGVPFFALEHQAIRSQCNVSVLDRNISRLTYF